MAPVVAGFFDLQGFELLQRVAKAFASSSLVPQQYQNNVANCMIALNLARRLRADELMVMQNLYIVHGNPGWSSKFLIASVNTCGRFETLRYEWRGQAGTDDYGCRAWTIERSTGEKLFGTWIDWKMVKAEGWNKKSGSKWLTMPDQMFIYRAAAFWQRGYAPEISMGLMSHEELQDTLEGRQAKDGTISVDVDALRAQAADQAAGNRSVATPKHQNATDVEARDVPSQTHTSPVRAQTEVGNLARGAAPAAPAPQAEPTGGQQANLPGAGEDSGLDPAAVEHQLVHAKTLDVLDLASDSIDGVNDLGVRANLHQIYQDRRAAMVAAQQQAEAQQQQQQQRPASTTRRRMAAPE
ncbi:hypothetical protein IPU70_07890 [Achromobacter sp. SD115]|nr:hypothetical protein [Achromobacter sp. SD115]